MHGLNLPPEVSAGLGWFYLLAALLNIGGAAHWVFWSRGQKLLTIETYLVSAGGALYGIMVLGWLFDLPAMALYIIAALAHFAFLAVVMPASIYQKVWAATVWSAFGVFFQVLGLLYIFELGRPMPEWMKGAIDRAAGPVTFFFGSSVAFAAFIYFRCARVAHVRIGQVLALAAAVLVALICAFGFSSTGMTALLLAFVFFIVAAPVLDRVMSETNPTGDRRPKTLDIRVPFGLTDPPVMWGVMNVALLFFACSMTDFDFRLIVAKPDNVPITMMLVFVGFFTWLFLRRAVINDQRLAQGLQPVEAEESEKVLVWPDLVYTEMLAMIVGTVILVLWSILLKAPLEAWSNLTKTPNPSKAPWYFLGLQEMLVYYDPWAAGVVFPSLIIFGLMAIPFIDFNKQGSGYFTYIQRRFSIIVFMFGFIVLWVLMVLLGTFLRGPGWNFFGPYQFWDPHMVRPLNNIDLSEVFWIHLLGRGRPNYWLLREMPGFVLVFAYFMLLPPILAKTVFREFFVRMGFARYMVFIVLVLGMAALPIKMLLRWSFNLKYIIHIDEFFFNI